LSGKFFQRTLFAAVNAILGAIVTSHTHTPKCNDPPKIRAISLLQKYSSLFSLCRLRITTELRSGNVEKMAGIFTKRIWRPKPAQQGTLHLAEVGLKLLPSLKTFICGIYHVMTVPWVSQHCSTALAYIQYATCNKLYGRMCWSKHCS